MNNNLFPDIKGALRRRGKLATEEVPSTALPDQKKTTDPLDTMSPQDRLSYFNELKKLDSQEQQLRIQIDKIKKSKMDLKTKYKLPV